MHTDGVRDGAAAKTVQMHAYRWSSRWSSSQGSPDKSGVDAGLVATEVGRQVLLQSERSESLFPNLKEKDVEARLISTEVKRESYTSRRASPQQVLPNPLVGFDVLIPEGTCLVDADPFSSKSFPRP